MLYRVVVHIWDSIWLTVFLLWVFSVHKVTYIYCAIIRRVKYVAYAEVLVSRCSALQFCTRHVLNPTYNSTVDKSYFMHGEKPQQKHCKSYEIPKAHNHPVKH